MLHIVACIICSCGCCICPKRLLPVCAHFNHECLIKDCAEAEWCSSSNTESIADDSSGACSIQRTVRVHASRKREWKRSWRGGGGRDRVMKMMATDAEEIRIQTSPCPIPDNSLSTLSIKITRKNQDRHWKLRFIYLQCCEYRHTSRRLQPNTSRLTFTSLVRIYWKCAATLDLTTFGSSRQQNTCSLHIYRTTLEEPKWMKAFDVLRRSVGGGPARI